MSVDDLDRDRRISALEHQVLVLSGQIAARDSAITQLLREMYSLQVDAISEFITQYPSMLNEIDTRVLSAITDADQVEAKS